MKKYILAIITLTALTPSVAFAVKVKDVESLTKLISTTISSVMPLIVGLAVLFFIFAVLKFMMNSGDEEEQKKARSMMLYGIIAIFVMVSVWGLVGILQGTFDFDNKALDAPSLPKV